LQRENEPDFFGAGPADDREHRPGRAAARGFAPGAGLRLGRGRRGRGFSGGMEFAAGKQTNNPELSEEA
jgi:hypothetical protein